MLSNTENGNTKEHFIDALAFSSPVAASILFSEETERADVFFDQVSRELVLRVLGAVSGDPGFRMPVDNVTVSSCNSASLMEVAGEDGCRPLPCRSEDLIKILAAVREKFPVPIT